MTDPHVESPLSSAELVVLACLSQSKQPSDDALANAVHELCLPAESPARARTVALAAVESLQRHAYVTIPGIGKGKRESKAKKVTEAGAHALCVALGIAHKPIWSAVRDKHLPALGLGLQPGSEIVPRGKGSVEALSAAVLRVKLGVREGATPLAVCDALVAEKLGLPPGELTLDRIRSHVLTQRAGAFHGATETPARLASRVAAALVGAPAEGKPTKQALLLALGRRALQRDTTGSTARVADTPMPDPSSPDQAGQSASLRLVPPSILPGPRPSSAAGTVPPPQASPPDSDLLGEVQDAIRQIGADGRFGTEKVFVSALWHRIEEARRPGLSLDGFKRWLLAENREGRLMLARADLVGAMDPKQVAESEIRDVGKTFHFVLDAQRGEPASRGGSHVR